MIDQSHRLHVCPADGWEKGVEAILAELKRQGMTPSSRVLDVGCGCLRIGKPLIEYLERNSYAGVEPAASILHAGIEKELGQELLNAKNPVFLYSPNFDFSPLQGPFDFILANEVFIHCSAEQFALFLARSRSALAIDGKILLTVNIGFDRAVPKGVPANSLEEKAHESRFLYAHAANNSTFYSEESFGMLTQSARFTGVTLHEYGCGNYVRRMKLLTSISG